MAQTPQQWLLKVQSWIPAWWIEEAVIAPGVLYAIANLLAQIDADCTDQFDTTFILQAENPVLALLGYERNITQLAGESISSYRARIQRITSSTDYQSILNAVNNLLLNKGAKIQRMPLDKTFASRGTFASRDQYLCTFLENFFILIIPKQIHAPYSFASRQTFASRGNFVGTDVTPAAVYQAVIALVNSMIAEGVMYSLVESTRNVVV